MTKNTSHDKSPSGNVPAAEAASRSTKALEPYPSKPARITTKGDRRGRVDIHTIAKHAGVSIATVSRVTNGNTKVAPELVMRVQRAIQDLGYTPSRHAQAMGSGRSRLLGLLIPEISNPFYPELIQAFEDESIKQGFEMITGSTYGDNERAAMWTRRMLQHGVQGIAVLTLGSEPAAVYEIARHIPTVNVYSGPTLRARSTIHIDFSSGIRQAIAHLAALGHKYIAFAGAVSEGYTAAQRLESFTHALAEFRLPIARERVFQHHHTFTGGSEAAKYILTLRNRPTALICSNDLMAIGALNVLRQSGLQLPRDLSMIGCDDTTIAEFTTPPLTTIVLSRRTLAAMAFKALMRQFDRESDCIEESLPTSLHIRESTTAPMRRTRG